MDITLGISSREETALYHDHEFTHLLSLLDPERGHYGVTPPQRTQEWNLIPFHDIDDIEYRAPKYFDCIAPTEDHIKQIFACFKKFHEDRGTGILVHCEAGISRSTAAAMLGLVSLGVDPQSAFFTVTKINELGLPNRRMLRIGGKMLGDNGRLLELAEAQRVYLFAKYDQLDPIETLRKELEKKPWASIELERWIWKIKNLGQSMERGSDMKMIDRLKIKLAMLKG